MGAIENHPEYKLILQCNRLAVDIENDVVNVAKVRAPIQPRVGAHVLFAQYIRENYSKKFSELESLVLNPVDYARTVKAIGNTTVRPFSLIFLC